MLWRCWLCGRKGIWPFLKQSGVVVCLEQGADLHIAQLMPLPLTVSCFSKIQIGFTFLVPAHLVSPGKRAVKRVCLCVCVCIIVHKDFPGSSILYFNEIHGGWSNVKIWLQPYISQQIYGGNKKSGYSAAARTSNLQLVYVWLFSASLTKMTAAAVMTAASRDVDWQLPVTT